MRDGSTFNGQLLLDMRGNSNTAPQYIESTGRDLHVEFTSKELIPVQPDLFYALYEIMSEYYLLTSIKYLVQDS